MEAKLRDLRRKAMFWCGLSSREIAVLEGVNKNSLADWRKARGVKCNYVNRVLRNDK